MSGFGRNSDSDMRAIRNCDVKRFETQTGEVRNPPNRERMSLTLLKGGPESGIRTTNRVLMAMPRFLNFFFYSPRRQGNETVIIADRQAP